MRWAEVVVAISLFQLIAMSPSLAAIDLRSHRLPNVFTVPAVITSQLTLIGALAITTEWSRYFQAQTVFVIVIVAGLLANQLAGVGMGDVKLLLSMLPTLAWFSAIAPMVALASALVSAAIAGWSLLATKRMRPSDHMALGPFLVLGLVVSALNLLVDWPTAAAWS